MEKFALFALAVVFICSVLAKPFKSRAAFKKLLPFSEFPSLTDEVLSFAHLHTFGLASTNANAFPFRSSVGSTKKTTPMGVRLSAAARARNVSGRRTKVS